jgi:hypothetical protein
MKMRMRSGVFVGLVLALMVMSSGCTDSKPDPCDDATITATVSNAVRSKDPGICDSISIQSCKDTCINHASVNKGDSSACPKINDEKSRDNCYAMVGVNTKDKSLCDKVKDTTLKNTCLKGGL